MKSCQDFAVLLSEYVDDELSDVQRREVCEHVADCPACAQRIDSFRRLNERIMNELAPSAGLRSRIEDRCSMLANANLAATPTQVTPTNPQWQTWMWQMLAVAAAVAIFAGIPHVTRRGATPLNVVDQEKGSAGLNVVEPLASLHRTSIRQVKTQQLLRESLEWELRAMRLTLEKVQPSDQAAMLALKIDELLDRVRAVESDEYPSENGEVL